MYPIIASIFIFEIKLLNLKNNLKIRTCQCYFNIGYIFSNELNTKILVAFLSIILLPLFEVRDEILMHHVSRFFDSISCIFLKKLIDRLKLYCTQGIQNESNKSFVKFSTKEQSKVLKLIL
ncbi:hypothetical protein BpHYR1_043887 [Brachionus plicatilis]|uniref:Uncharacterized protein n=1 Tax=Brachionus plicatilis TaxID=10195 RepID=A0A3M7T7K7_BRAPC|nr:hypothetical protein BpHYR1_043887 [Brachionus plicatilis]